MAVGSKIATRKLQKVLEDAYKIKCEVLGDEQGEVSEIRVLNRIVRRDEKGFTIEADPRHAELAIRDLELTTAKGSKLPGSKEESKKTGGGPAGAGEYPVNSVEEIPTEYV